MTKMLVNQLTVRNGTVKTADQIDWTGDWFGRTKNDAGWYVWFGMWKGPFSSKEDAKEAYREWKWEFDHS